MHTEDTEKVVTRGECKYCHGTGITRDLLLREDDCIHCFGNPDWINKIEGEWEE